MGTYKRQHLKLKNAPPKRKQSVDWMLLIGVTLIQSSHHLNPR